MPVVFGDFGLRKLKPNGFVITSGPKGEVAVEVSIDGKIIQPAHPQFQHARHRGFNLLIARAMRQIQLG